MPKELPVWACSVKYSLHKNLFFSAVALELSALKFCPARNLFISFPICCVMFASHRPRVFRSRLGCCICGAKSSSSRFTSSSKYELLFRGCFQLNEERQGEICNACVLLVKRWKKLPSGSAKNWKHVSWENLTSLGCRVFRKSANRKFKCHLRLCQFLAQLFFFLTQVVDSKATVKRTTKPRRSSRNSMTVENGNELTSTMNGSRATSGRSASCGGQETRGWLSSLLFIRKT